MAAMVMASSRPQSEATPTIKCATCSRPIALDELETHVCAAPPPKLSATPSSANIRQSKPPAPGQIPPPTARGRQSPAPAQAPARAPARTPPPAAAPPRGRATPPPRTPSPLRSSSESARGPGPAPGPPTPTQRAVSPLALRPQPPPQPRAPSPAGPSGYQQQQQYGSPPSNRGPPPPRMPQQQQMQRQQPPPSPTPARRAPPEPLNLRGGGPARLPEGMMYPSTPTSNSSPRRSITLPHPHQGRSRADSLASIRTASFAIDAFMPDPSRQSIMPSAGESEIPVVSLNIPDTESGGSAGRAGVGRRAFAAVAHAALIASSFPPHPQDPYHQQHQQHPPYGMPPHQYLDINNNGRGTPALSIPRSSPSPGIRDLRTPSPGFDVGGGPRVATGQSDDGHQNMISRNDWATAVPPPTPKVIPPKRRNSSIESFTELGYHNDEPEELPIDAARPQINRANTAPDAFGRPYQTGVDLPLRGETIPLDIRGNGKTRNPLDHGRSSSPTSDPSLSSSTSTLPDSITFPSGRPSFSSDGGDDDADATPGPRESVFSASSSYTSPSLPPDEENNRLSQLTDATARLSLSLDRSSSSGSTSTVRGPNASANARKGSRRVSKSTGSRPKEMTLNLETLQEEGESSSARLAPLSPLIGAFRSSSATEIDIVQAERENPDLNASGGFSSGSGSGGIGPLSASSLTIPGMGLNGLDRLSAGGASGSGSGSGSGPRGRTKSGPSSVSGASSSSGGRRQRTPKTCIKCGKTIEDGRWIAVHDDVVPASPSSPSPSSPGGFSSASSSSLQTSQPFGTVKSISGSSASGGSSSSGRGDVLCEKDWKEMYLPKCRRCGLTIESQAVSSADGQLKGKYHRACFNCSTCHKPFPDKEFYVLGGAPYCEYHYHVANNSLCSSPSCGRPIEGPCAEDHDGRRYHPEHLLCAAHGCSVRLVEYWCDPDGRMVCEKHVGANLSPGGNLSSPELSVGGGSLPPSPNSGGELQLSSRSEKRRTRFLEI